MQNNPEDNKQNAIAFYRTAYLGDPAKAVEIYVGAEYIQHNPLVGNGKQALVDYFTEMADQYPNKEIESALQYAESRGWRFVEAGGSAHAWGRMLCAFATREGCMFSVWSTPRVPKNHARQIRRNVDRCPHQEVTYDE